MGNITLPTPVAVAGVALCLLGGWITGVVAGPSGASTTTATVESYDRTTRELCLGGDGVAGLDGLDEDGRLCGTWQRTPGSSTPQPDDDFRFTVMTTRGDGQSATYLYGDVVR